jgi:hypothetical protein
MRTIYLFSDNEMPYRKGLYSYWEYYSTSYRMWKQSLKGPEEIPICRIVLHTHYSPKTTIDK